VTKVEPVLRAECPLTVRVKKDEMLARMTDHAGTLCAPQDVASSLQSAKFLNRKIPENGIAFTRSSEISRVLQWQQIALASEAVLAALHYYIAKGGVSRGAPAMCDESGAATPMVRSGPLHEARFREEYAADQGEQVLVQLTDGELEISTRPNRSFDESDRPFFERDWPAWLIGEVFDLDLKKTRDA